MSTGAVPAALKANPTKREVAPHGERNVNSVFSQELIASFTDEGDTTVCLCCQKGKMYLFHKIPQGCSTTAPSSCLHGNIVRRISKSVLDESAGELIVAFAEVNLDTSKAAGNLADVFVNREYRLRSGIDEFFGWFRSQ